MKVKLMEFNPVDGLQSEEEIAQYLADCFQDDNPAVFVTALGYVAKRKGIANIAQDTGLNRENLYKSLSGDKQLRWDTIHRVMKSLNIKLQPTA